MNHDLTMLITLVSSVGFGLFAQVLARYRRIPAIVLLLPLGISLGPAGLHLIEPASLEQGLGILVKLAVAIILFEGALNLRITTLRHSVREVRNLVTLGVLLTWGLVTAIGHYVAGLDWTMATLFGALMTVTGPTVVQPLLSRIDIPRSVRTVLEGEAILIDPIGAILAIATLDVVLSLSSPEPMGVLSALWSYVGRLAIGSLVGAAGAIGLSRLMRLSRVVPPDLSNLVALASLWVCFGVAESFQSEAGIVASVVMGLVLQRETVPGERELRHFKESLTTLSISVLFVLLAADLPVEAVWAESLSGVCAILLIMFVARPMSVFLSTWRSGLDWREKAFIAWIGPRGIVAASVASLFAFTLREIGIADGDRVLALTFMAIIVTVTVQGLTASAFAHILRLHSMQGRKTIVVGANHLGCLVAEVLRANGRPVVLVDTNPRHIRTATRLGFEALRGNALDQGTLEDARIEEAETVVAVTPNSEVNVLVSQIAREVFRIPRAFPALSDPEKGASPKLLEQTGGKAAFGVPFDMSVWEYTKERLQQFTWIVPAQWPGTRIDRIPFPKELLPVLRLRGNNPEVTHAEQVWRPGDTVVFIIGNSPEHAVQQLNALCGEEKVTAQT